MLLQSIKLAQRLSCYIPETDANRHTKITRRLQLTFIQEVNEVQSKNVKNTKNFMLHRNQVKLQLGESIGFSTDFTLTHK